MTQQLIKYDAAISALAECKAVDEVKDWHDKAAAMQAYGRIAKDKTLETDAAEIRIRAERRLGQLIEAQKTSAGLAKPGPKSLVSNEGTPKLADAGISYDLSARAQKLAAVPEKQFESEVGEWRERVTAEGARVTARLETAGEAALKAKPAKQEESPEPVAATDDPRDKEIAVLREQLSELTSNLDSAVKDIESMARVFEANDQLAAALAEAKRYREQVRIADERIRGLMGEKNTALSQAKMWMRRCEKAERALKEADGVTF